MARFSGGRIIFISFLAVNCGLGVTYGSFGPIVTTIQQHFGVSRGIASMGISTCLIAMGVFSPLIGNILQRFSVRAVMTAGAILSAAGYLSLIIVDNIYELLAVYCLLIGTGMTALGYVPCSTLISRWFIQDRGKALGFMGIPFFIMIFPLITAPVLQRFGLDAVFMVNAATFMLLIPLLFLVIETPESVGQLPHGASSDVPNSGSMSGPDLSNRDVLLNLDFWILSCGASIITASGLVMVVQLVPLLTGRGITPATAAHVLSVHGLMLIAGTLGSGWLADRVGVVTAYMVCAFVLIVPFAGLIFVPATVMAYLPLVVIAALCNGGVSALHAGSANELFGRRSYARVMGLSYFAKLPSMVAAPPLAGLAYDLTGSYNTAMAAMVVLVIVAGLCFILLNARRAHWPAVRDQAATGASQG